MFVFTVATAFILAISLVEGEKVCMSQYGKVCLKKSEVGPYSMLMETGDPCFDHSGNSVCFTNTEGLVEPCNLNAEGCGGDNSGAPVEDKETCDNSEVPKKLKCKKKYCKKFSEEHSMCKYCGINKEKCGDVCQHGLSKSEEDIILLHHNELRARVAAGNETRGVGGQGQPKAVNMPPLKWDKDLAEIAQRWADQCTPGHDEERSSYEFSSVGQNYALYYSSRLSKKNDVNKFVTGWYDEVDYFPAKNVEKLSYYGTTGPVGHYTQFVWAKTTTIGCGFIQYKEPNSKYYRMALVCNYGPAGNYIGTPVYEIAK